MLLILIPIAWFAIVALVMVLCRMASHSDSVLAQQSEQDRRAALPTQDQREPLPTVTLTPPARWADTPTVIGPRAALAWAPRERTTRTRQGRCITGS